MWRMPAFFIVAGFFAVMMLRRRPAGRWWKGRLRRLGIPLLFGMIILNPLQWITLGYFDTMSSSSAFALAMSKALPPSFYWTMHLWFLVELLIYCAIVAAIFATPLRSHTSRIVGRCVSWIINHPVAGIAIYLVVLSMLVGAGLAAWQVLDLGTVFAGLISRNIVIFAPAFLTGCLLATRSDLLSAFTRISMPALSIVGFGCVAVILVIELGLSSESSAILSLQSIAWTVGGLTLSAVVFAIASKVFVKPSSLVRVIVDASLVVYLLHQPLIILIGNLLIDLRITGVVAWVVTVASTLIIALLAYEAVNRVPGMRFLMSGRADRGWSFLDLRNNLPEAAARASSQGR